jgi:hypothetical protein
MSSVRHEDAEFEFGLGLILHSLERSRAYARTKP